MLRLLKSVEQRVLGVVLCVRGTAVRDNFKDGGNATLAVACCGGFFCVELLKDWNHTDPPSCREMRRNSRVLATGA